MCVISHAKIISDTVGKKVNVYYQRLLTFVIFFICAFINVYYFFGRLTHCAS